MRRCANELCQKVIADSVRSDQLYCCKSCRSVTQQRRKREREAGKVLQQPAAPTRAFSMDHAVMAQRVPSGNGGHGSDRVQGGGIVVQRHRMPTRHAAEITRPTEPHAAPLPERPVFIVDRFKFMR